jgi:hypothetical protein
MSKQPEPTPSAQSSECSSRFKSSPAAPAGRRPLCVEANKPFHLHVSKFGTAHAIQRAKTHSYLVEPTMNACRW